MFSLFCHKPFLRTAFLILSMSFGSFAHAQTSGQLSAESAKRLATDIRPAVVQMLGDDKIVGAELLDAIVATVASYRQDNNLILYSPIYSIVLILHTDTNRKLFVYAFGFEELAELVQRPLKSQSNYLELRYKEVPSLIAALKAALANDRNFIIKGVHAASQRSRKTQQNQEAVLKPVFRQIDQDNLRCIKTLDKDALVANIKTGLADKADESWFDNMTMGDILTNTDGSKMIIFVNDQTRRLHLLVPVTQQAERCVPGAPLVTYLQ